MPSRIPVAIDRLQDQELIQIAADLAGERDVVRAELSNLKAFLGFRDANLRKGIFRIIIYGMMGLLGLIVADAAIDLAVLLPLVAVAMMVWEALDFAKEVSEYRDLEEAGADLAERSFLIDRDLGLIAGELKRRESEARGN